MKKILFLIVLIVSSIYGFSAMKNHDPITGAVLYMQHSTGDPIWDGIQGRIKQAFVMDVVSENPKALAELQGEMMQNYRVAPSNLKAYWIGYCKYWEAILMITKEKKEASEIAIETGISLIKELKGKNSEDYALLALMQGFSMQFKGMQAMFISGQVRKNISKAIKLDANNVRAHYVAASNDFYTPDQYGGGKKAEKYLLKALGLERPEQVPTNMPSWGFEESYELMIQHYIKKSEIEKAKEVYKKGVEEFPGSQLLNRLAKDLI